MDVRRLGKNFSYMARALAEIEESEYEKAGRAVLWHHFDKHDHCGGWCKRKDQSEDERAKAKRFYRSTEKDEKLWADLDEAVARFITKERLGELDHGMDTNANESLNQTISYIAPKNRVYCRSRSLQNLSLIHI